MVVRQVDMDGKARLPPDALLQLARRGDQEALGDLLEGYRRYVELMARLQLDRTMQRKIAPSDVAQETFSQAHSCFHQFRGRTEGELLQWLRRIVASQLATVARRLHAKRRDVRLEEQLGEELDQSSDAVGVWLAANGSSPSQGAARREQAVVLANALAELRPDYREVIILRHLEGMEFSDIALRMGKTLASVKNIWARAIAELRKTIPES